ncbi:divalent-cation tolerance protein CutA [Campylobacter sp. MIT 99-7217]|nr:divalent-cation tolerance protein CutA [Campylobacter sp. MIT 99-7217]
MRIIKTTFSSKEEAEKITQILLEKRLVACVQSSKIKSSYLWQNKLCHDKEILLSIKTTKRLCKEVKRLIIKLHSYETPQILTLKPKKANKAYKIWLESVLNKE